MSQQHPVNATLEEFNRLEQETATEVILPCNGSRAWAIGIVNARSFETSEELFAASDRVWRSLDESAWLQAFDSHPRIGEHRAKAAAAQSLQWSRGEQASAQSDDAMQTALAKGNRAYEAKFGRIFIVCASGRTAAEMLAILQQRLKSDAATELREAAEQQRLITQLRLRKWLGLPVPSCAQLAAAS